MVKKTETETVDPATGEIGTQVAPSISQKAMTLPNGKVMTLIKQVTLPLLKHGDGQTVVFRADSAMYLGKQLKAKTPDEPAPKRATMVKCFDQMLQQDSVYIVPAVLEDTWKTDYPSDSYIGKCFAIQKQPKKEGQRHKDLVINEVSVD